MSEETNDGYTVDVSTSSTGKEVTRYKLNGQLVKASEVPEEVKERLAVPAVVEEEAPLLSEDDIVDASDEETVAAEAVEEVPSAPVVALDSPDDIDDESGVDEEVAPAPKADASDEEGMGFPRKKGKTVDIFDGKTPHTHVRYVSGVMVPLTKENYDTRSDAEIVTKLEKLGKI